MLYSRVLITSRVGGSMNYEREVSEHVQEVAYLESEKEYLQNKLLYDKIDKDKKGGEPDV